MRKHSEIKTGVLLSYALLIINTIYGLLITPSILKYVGDSSYGVYKSVSSLSASLAVMDLGLGATMTRYMAKYNARNEREQASNFAAMMLIQCSILVVLFSVCGGFVYASIQGIYSGTFSQGEIILAKKLVAVLLLNMVLRLLENLLSGIAMGFERFTVANGVKLVSVLLKFTLILVLLPIVKNILLVVLLETALVSVSIIYFGVYIHLKIGIKPRLKQWDQKVFHESMGYTLLMFIQTLTVQFNGNVDNILIGARLGASSVTVYSMSLVIFGMYENLSGSIANIMLPNMTKRIEANQTAEQLQKGVEKAGKYQFILLGAALGGFIVLGQDFYKLWLGSGFEDCYWLTLILIIPVTFPMVQNVSLSILRAKNKMGYRTTTLALSCVVNVIVTLIGLRQWGYWGAAIGTACATIANLVFMNVYYKRHLQFRIFQMFMNIMGKTAVCAGAAAAAVSVLHLWLNSTWISIVINAGVFMAIYGALLLVWGMNAEEKQTLLGRLGR